jgi:hypothetical protein
LYVTGVVVVVSWLESSWIAHPLSITTRATDAKVLITFFMAKSSTLNLRTCLVTRLSRHRFGIGGRSNGHFLVYAIGNSRIPVNPEGADFAEMAGFGFPMAWQLIS